MLVKIGKYIGFCVYRRSYLLWSPVISTVQQSVVQQHILCHAVCIAVYYVYDLVYYTCFDATHRSSRLFHISQYFITHHQVTSRLASGCIVRFRAPLLLKVRSRAFESWHRPLFIRCETARRSLISQRSTHRRGESPGDQGSF